MEDSQIVDAIDAKRFTHARSLIKLKTAKNPNSSYYLALHCYLVFKASSASEALEESVKLLNKFPTDTRTTNLLFKIFNQLGKTKEACLVYENLVKRYPNHCENALLQWFENGINVGNLSFVQKASMHLSKVAKNTRKYKLWASFACYLWSQTVEDAKQTALFSQLSRKLLDGLTPESTQELFVFTKSAADEEALELIENFNDELDLDVQLIYVNILDKLQKWKKLDEFAASLLFDKSFNDFDTWKLYIKSNKELGTPFDVLEQKITSYKFSRNTSLALVELATVYSHDKLDSFISEYYSKFRTKPCCFYDLRHYSATSFVQKMPTSIQLGEINVDSMNALINDQKLRFALGKVDNDFFVQNWNIYNHFIPLTKSKQETDFYLANDLVLINVIHDLSRDSSHQNILKSITILTYLLQNDPYDTKLNLWLIRLLNVFNFNSEVLRVFQVLKIKTLQHESLGYIVTNRLSTLAPAKKNVDFMVNVFRLYLTCEQDLNENVLKSFNEGIYNKLENFITFRAKMTQSIHHYQVLLEIIRMARVNNDRNYESYFSHVIDINHEEVLDDKISDNRDFQTAWKGLGFSKEFVSKFHLDPEPPVIGPSYLKLNYLKELLLAESDYKKLSSYMKLLNKNMNSDGLTSFETWLFKVYASLFKLKSRINDNELNSSLNFLTKNLKFTKVQPFLKTEGWELTSNILSLAELSKIITRVIDNCSYDVNSLRKANEQLLNDIRTPDFKNSQLAQLRTYKQELLSTEFPIPIEKEFIDDLFDKLNDSMNNSAYTAVKY